MDNDDDEDDDDDDDHAQDIYDQCQDFLQVLTSSRNPAVQQSIFVFPQSPAELLLQNPVLHAQIYGTGTEHEFQPVPCPFDESLLLQVRAKCPTRKTHSSMSLQIKRSRTSCVALQSSPALAMHAMYAHPALTNGAEHMFQGPTITTQAPMLTNRPGHMVLQNGNGAKAARRPWTTGIAKT